MTATDLFFSCIHQGGFEQRTAILEQLVIAGWTGRDQKAVMAHIEELHRIGVPPPRKTPIIYRVAATLLTQAETIQVAGRDSSGEVEAVFVSFEDGLWVGLGSDHTDRKLEAHGITLSKQVCAKPIGTTLWRYNELHEHWDRLQLRSFATIDGRRRLYQEGVAAHMRSPDDLFALYSGQPRLPFGEVMYGGTLAVHGPIGFATLFEMELHDPVLNRTLTHSYVVHDLPIEG
ncbi:MAG: DUF2848 domain-containing protein [Pseudomonadota bacterium]